MSEFIQWKKNVFLIQINIKINGALDLKWLITNKQTMKWRG